jgi:hypothetical protein
VLTNRVYRTGSGVKPGSTNADVQRAAGRAAGAAPVPFVSDVAREEREAKRSLLPAPNPGPQSALLECPIKDVFYGGARFGGKTFGLLLDWAEHVIRWGKHATGILFRRTYNELKEVIRLSRELFTPLGWTYNESEHRWSTPEGATLHLAYLRRESDADTYQGWSVSWFGVDEAGNFPTLEWLDKLFPIIRSGHIPLEHCVRRLTGNPGGPGHAALKARYIDGQIPFRPFKYQPMESRKDLTIDAVFIPSTLDDNYAALQGQGASHYEAQIAMAAHDDPALYEAWRHGNFEVFVGQAFALHRRYHIVPTRSLAPHELCVGGLDWGYQQGWIGLATRDQDGRWEIVHEVYFSEIDAFHCAEAVAKRWIKAGLRPTQLYYDDQMDQQSGVKAGMTLVSEFRAGLASVYGDEAPVMTQAAKGPGSRKVKYQLVQKLIKYQAQKDGSILPWHRPKLTIQERCKHLIRTLWALPDDPDKPREDVDTEAEDHPYDGMCNILLSMARAEARDPQDTITPDRHPGMKGKHRVKPRKLRPDGMLVGQRVEAPSWQPNWHLPTGSGDEDGD